MSLAAVHHRSDIFPSARFVRPDINNQVLVKLKIFGKIRLDCVQAHRLLFQPESSLRGDLHGTDVVLRKWLIGIPPFWQMEIDALLQQRRRNYKNDQQHKRKVQQRRDVNLAERYQGTAL